MAPSSYPLLHELEAARPGGADGQPLASSPVYCVSYAKGGLQLPPGVSTCYELFQ
jgi:hypothetical protein